MINGEGGLTPNYLARGIFFGYLSQIVGIIVGLISVPMMLHYFDREQYGIWTLVAGIVGYLSLSSLGIPASASVLISKLTNDFAKFLILKKSFFLLILVSIIVLSLACLFNWMFPGWIGIIGELSSANIEPAKEALIVMGGGALVRASLSIALSAFSGFQRMDIVKIYELLTTLVVFAALSWTVYANHDLVYLAWVTAIASVMISVLSVIHFSYKYRSIRNKKEYENQSASVRLIVSSSFFVFQAGAACVVIGGAGNLIISNMLGVETVPVYAIACRLFGMGFLLFTLLNAVLLPMYGNAFGNNDWVRLQKIYDLQIDILPIIAGAVWIGGVMLSKEIIQLWTGRVDMFGGYLLVFALGGYGFILSFISIHSGILTALNHSSAIARVAWLEAFLGIFFAMAFVKMLGIGGAALGTMLAALLSTFILLPKYLVSLTQGRLTINLKKNNRQFRYALLPGAGASMIFVRYADEGIYSLVFAFFVLLSYSVISWKLLSGDARLFILGFWKCKKKIW